MPTRLVSALLLSLLCPALQAASPSIPRFVEVTQQLGIAHRFAAPELGVSLAALHTRQGRERMVYNAVLANTGGLAVGDINHDHYPDIFLNGGIHPPKLYLNQAGKRFVDISAAAGLAVARYDNGASFAEINGDGQPDLIIGGSVLRLGKPGEPAAVPAGLDIYINQGQQRFKKVLQPNAGFRPDFNSFSTAFGDFDRDGDLDLAMGRWHSGPINGKELPHLWENREGYFVPADARMKIAGSFPRSDFSFTPTFADINNDQWPDLLMVNDFEQTQLFINHSGKHYSNITNPLRITDENGMGSAVGDIDNDGDLDWFISSIYDPDKKATQTAIGHWGRSGNRLYRNDGNGEFSDITAASQLRDGGWGWGSCMADFNNDGILDIFHVTGFGYPDSPAWAYFAAEFQGQPHRLFLGSASGQYTEASLAAGIRASEGRAISCLDFDRDGDIDLLISNLNQPVQLYRNQSREQASANHFIGIRLQGAAGNPQVAGAKIILTSSAGQQMREIRIGSNYLSQNPAEAHFGLGKQARIDSLRVIWPYAPASEYKNLSIDQWHTLSAPPVPEAQ